MFGYGHGWFDSSDGLLIEGGRVYEFSGHLGAWGITATILGIILWAIVVTTLVLVIIELVRRQRRVGLAPDASDHQSWPAMAGVVPGAPEALRVLDERYARGEIGRDEYFARRADLMGLAGQPAQAPVAPQP